MGSCGKFFGGIFYGGMYESTRGRRQATREPTFKHGLWTEATVRKRRRFCGWRMREERKDRRAGWRSDWDTGRVGAQWGLDLRG